ncbi:organic cation transporter protein-like isoform X2 [Athalia rosae]|uniref:organic cation transporter protein-like isoform X2 n=2 Tax=Athalia rosae TaxID=37344 RepID=UPI00203472AD|nr:organic cation transporter protein-like isoform X2 [Athalia rosae]
MRLIDKRTCPIRVSIGVCGICLNVQLAAFIQIYIYRRAEGVHRGYRCACVYPDAPNSDLIQDAMGNFGPWHLLIAISVSLVKFPVAWNQLSIVFLAPPVEFNCIEPISSTNSSMSCKVDVTGHGNWQKCTKFEYDRTIFRESIITQWDLVCDKNQLANVAQTVTMFGILMGNMIFGIIADRMGRKIPLIIAVLIQSVTGLASAFAPWYELFLALKFLAALATGGTMLISFVLLMEIVGVNWRSNCSVLFHVPFMLGHLLNPAIAYLTRTWSGFQIAVSVPPILLLSYYWIIPESPRWLLAVGRVEEAEAVLTKAAKRNGISLDKVKAAIGWHENHKAERDFKHGEKKYNITHLFRTPNLRTKTICVCFNWLACGICFFGLAQYVGYLSGDIFINVAASAAMELPGTVLVLFLISRVSRLKILMAGNLISSLSVLLLIFITDPTFRVCLATLGLVGMSISFPTVYLYSSEAFPTVVRNVGIGLASLCARTGSMVAPYIATMNAVQPWLPPVLFSVCPLIGVCLCFLLPETMNCELPETIEDGENFGKKKSIIESSDT